MKNIYPKLAWSGIKNNRRLYVPYILTCIGMIMMFYIMEFLTLNPAIKNMPGGQSLQYILQLGVLVIGTFAVIFLFYTNSFLLRRRKKEFGLYNVLGMGKRNLAAVQVFESLIVAVIALAAGLFLGITFSKFAELLMLNIMGQETNFSIYIAWQSIRDTICLFGLIFVLLYFNTVFHIRITNPIELLHSENAGEKPPKANWLFAVIGIVILAGAYYISVSIKNPLDALMWFFVAVIMVIAATYILFQAGSVTLCRLLQKNKKYYYKTNHFVSVSSMAYRMKRNGAGLASVCILCTMVLVMISTTACLYFGKEDSLRNVYPRDINFVMSFEDNSYINSQDKKSLLNVVEQVIEKNNRTAENIFDCQMASFVSYIENGEIETDSKHLESFMQSMSGMNFADVWQIGVISLEDYNKITGESETLNANEIMLYTSKDTDYENSTISFGDGEAFNIKKKLKAFISNGTEDYQLLPTMYMVVSDLEKIIHPLAQIKDPTGRSLISVEWNYCLDVNCSDDEKIEIYNEMKENVKQFSSQDKTDDIQIRYSCRALERDGFYSGNIGLFFLGIMLGLMFLMATVLIIYYKQVCEGYEDQSRFEIMQKVGMTQKEIKKSINSQILTVFFMPLAVAGMHLIFAFPIINKLLVMFALTNKNLLISITVICFIVFALFYMLVYHITSKAYYSIVSGNKEDEYIEF